MLRAGGVSVALLAGAFALMAAANGDAAIAFANLAVAGVAVWVSRSE